MNQKNAIPSAKGFLFPHFCKAPEITIINIINNIVTRESVLKAPEHEHGSMPRFIAAQGCTGVICGGLGEHAVTLPNQLNTNVHGGAPAIAIDTLT